MDEDMPALEEMSATVDPAQNKAANGPEMNDSGQSDDDDIGIDDGEDDAEVVEKPVVKCLFCDDISDSGSNLFTHMELTHQFSMKSMACHWSFDQLSFIKYVNYIRKEAPKPILAQGLKPAAYSDIKYMKPVIQDDNLLTFGK